MKEHLALNFYVSRILLKLLQCNTITSDQGTSSLTLIHKIQGADYNNDIAS